MKLRFSTPCAFEEGICAASFGFSGAPDERAQAIREFSHDLSCTWLTGSYEEILSQLPAGNWQAGIVLLGNGGGEDRFVRQLQEKAHCPLTGGSAAIDPVSGKQALVLGGGQAAVCLIQDDRYDITVESRNIHEELLGTHFITTDGPRVFATIDGEDALTWYQCRRREYGIPEEDFEHLTFSDTLGVNAHLSVVDGKLCSGRDLEPEMLLRRVAPERVLPQMAEFYDDPDALVCGCAGLKGILPRPLMAPGCGLFLFGEVATVGSVSKFGNLMLSKLCVRRKEQG